MIPSCSLFLNRPDLSLTGECTDSVRSPLAKSPSPDIHPLQGPLPAFIQNQEFPVLPWPFYPWWLRTHCSCLLISSSENMKMKIKRRPHGPCTHSSAQQEGAPDMPLLIPFYSSSFPLRPLNHWCVFLKMSLLSNYSLTPGFKHETQLCGLIKSRDNSFSTCFHDRPPRRSFYTLYS